jgi:hypothetical protein
MTEKFELLNLNHLPVGPPGFLVQADERHFPFCQANGLFGLIP